MQEWYKILMIIIIIIIIMMMLIMMLSIVERFLNNYISVKFCIDIL